MNENDLFNQSCASTIDFSPPATLRNKYDFRGEKRTANRILIVLLSLPKDDNGNVKVTNKYLTIVTKANRHAPEKINRGIQKLIQYNIIEVIEPSTMDILEDTTIIIHPTTYKINRIRFLTNEELL